MAVTKPLVGTPEQQLAMSLHTRISIAFDWLYALVMAPFHLTHFTLDVVLLTVFPFWRPSKSWNLNQAIRMRLLRLILLYISLLKAGDRLSLKPGRERNRFEVIQPKADKLYKGPLEDPVIKPETIGQTWTPARPPPRSLIGPDLIVALHIHGGAFAIGNGRDSDTGFFAHCLTRYMGATHVCTPQYRLSSSLTKGGRFPAPVVDALTSYLHLTRDRGIPAKQIILSGDSAGGNIAIGLLRYIHEHGKELDIPAPGGVALWSPWTDVHAATDSSLDMAMSPQYKTDYLNTPFARWGAKAVIGGGKIDPSGPYLSPLHHPFKVGDGEVPVFIHAGDHEVLADDIVEFTKKLKEVGWKKVQLTVSKYCPHDILLVGHHIGFAKEAEDAARQAGRFFAQSTDLKMRISTDV